MLMSRLIEPGRVHGAVFTDEEVLRRELEHVWLNGWAFVGHASEVPQAGDYCLKTVAMQPLVMARGTDGAVRVFYDRCPHSGVKFCISESGNAKTFRCPYHGWTFSSEGRLIGVPFPSRYSDPVATKESNGLTRVRTAEHRGFVFANLDGDAAVSFDAYLGDGGRDMIDRLLAMSPTGDIVLRAGWLKHRLSANWKLVAVNQVDGYHVRFTHGSLFEGKTGPRTDFDYGETGLVRSRDLGAGHTEIDFRPGYRAGGTRFQWFGHVKAGALHDYVAAMEAAYGSEEADRRLVDGPPHGLIFPNLFLAELAIYVMEPTSTGTTVAFSTPVTLDGHDEFNRRSITRMVGGMGPAGMLISDDAEIGSRIQQGLAARTPEWIDISRGVEAEIDDGGGRHTDEMTDETAIRGFWRHYAHVLQESAGERI